jgi:transglutaminase-like putative cysteine protease
MLIHVGHEWIFDVPSPTPALLKLSLHPSELKKVRQSEWLRIEPEIPREEFMDEFGNRVNRVTLPAGRVCLSHEAILSDSGQPDAVNEAARQIPIAELPVEILPYLLSSRYCEVDLLCDTALSLFGSTAPGWPRVQAVCDWVHSQVRFGYEYARPTKTAYEVYNERTGVCRDFMHLAVTFCRCLQIPARCATGYLGDIGVVPQALPMDFSSWFEAYLDRRWYTFDARFNVPRIGRILMARGRDAVDVALMSSFGSTNLEKLTVWADEVPEKA